MGYLPSRTLCRCIPVRFGVFIMSILGCIGGSVMAGLGWYSTVHKDETYLSRNQEISVVIASLSYTILGALSLLGLIGAVIRHRIFVSLYSTALWSHLALNVVAGAYFIYTLFHKVGRDDDLNNCISSYDGDLISQYTCVKEFEVYRGVIISIYIVFCLLELWVCLFVASYVVQLREEEALDNPLPARTTATVPPMATYNYTNDYAFSQPDNSFGRNISINV